MKEDRLPLSDEILENSDKVSEELFDLFNKSKTDPEALEQLALKVRDKAYRYGRRNLDNDRAEDFASTIVEKLLNNIKKLEATSHQELNGWLTRVQNNLLIDIMRKTKRHGEIHSGHPGQYDDGDDNPLSYDYPLTSPDEAVSNLEDQVTLESVRKTLANLSEDHRDVLIGHHLHGKRIDSLAQEHNLPEGTIKSRLSRAREKFSRRFNMIKKRDEDLAE